MSRDAILARIREALSVKTDDRFLESRHEPPPADFRACMPQPGTTFDERLATLRFYLDLLKVEFLRFHTLSEAGVSLHVKAMELGWKKIAFHDGLLARPAAEALGAELVNTSHGYTAADLEGCQVAITECEALVAQIGGVLVSSRNSGGRSLSVLPHHHVVLATPDQLVGDMSEGFDLVTRRYAPDYPSFVGFIAGASRTGDIERILVLGAHGPRKLTVVMVDSLTPPPVVELE